LISRLENKVKFNTEFSGVPTACEAYYIFLDLFKFSCKFVENYAGCTAIGYPWLKNQVLRLNFSQKGQINIHPMSCISYTGIPQTIIGVHHNISIMKQPLSQTFTESYVQSQLFGKYGHFKN
jgi:hypothetical protein